MARRITIAMDAMSGDGGCEPVVKAALAAVSRNRALSIILVGSRSILEAFLGSGHDRVEIVDAAQVVSMDERPSSALRHKRSSSMAVALELVRDGRAHGCVSAGNTGALMAFGLSLLQTHPGIERPAIIKSIPSPRGSCYVLDLGANVDASAEHLFQFALMGTLMAQAIEQRERPRVALLNVGHEAVKGTEQVRLASHMLSASDAINYVGYIEGNQLFEGAVDVAVCDGFVGNVALKTGEGVANMLMTLIRQAFRNSWYGRLVGLLALPLVRPLLRRMDPARRNGASLVGLQGVVIKSHGNAGVTALTAALEQAAAEVRQNLPERIGEQLDKVDF